MSTQSTKTFVARSRQIAWLAMAISFSGLCVLPCQHAGAQFVPPAIAPGGPGSPPASNMASNPFADARERNPALASVRPLPSTNFPTFSQVPPQPFMMGSGGVPTFQSPGVPMPSGSPSSNADHETKLLDKLEVSAIIENRSAVLRYSITGNAGGEKGRTEYRTIDVVNGTQVLVGTKGYRAEISAFEVRLFERRGKDQELAWVGTLATPPVYWVAPVVGDYSYRPPASVGNGISRDTLDSMGSSTASAGSGASGASNGTSTTAGASSTGSTSASSGIGLTSGTH